MPKKKEPKIDHSAIDPHFDGGMWRLIGNPEDCAPSVGELVLWRRVVLQALFDFCSIAISPKARYNQNQAERWFINSRKHFRIVCALADIDPEKLRDIVLKAHENPQTIFANLRDRMKRS